MRPVPIPAQYRPSNRLEFALASLSLAFALFITASISFAFKTTRGIGIVCLAVFCFLFPWISFAVICIVGVPFLVYHFRYR